MYPEFSPGYGSSSASRLRLRASRSMNNGGLPVHSCTRGSASSVLVITDLRSHRATHPTCRTKRICAAFCAGSSSIWSFSPERSAAARRRHLKSRRSPTGHTRLFSRRSTTRLCVLDAGFGFRNAERIDILGQGLACRQETDKLFFSGVARVVHARRNRH